jgi:hypothetical protein
MPTWRCPHCGAPQPESARCWVCRRSTTCCSTCRHFRRGVAGQLGYCGLDRRHAPLSGDEIRGCWQAATEARPFEISRGAAPSATAAATASTGVARPHAGRQRIDFVPVDEASGRHRGSTPPAPPPAAVDPTRRILRFILWEETEA